MTSKQLINFVIELPNKQLRFQATDIVVPKVPPQGNLRPVELKIDNRIIAQFKGDALLGWWIEETEE